MEALRGGDDVLSEALLTDVARKATIESDMKIQPTGSPQAAYRIGRAQMIGVDGARVESHWTEPKGLNESITYKVVWRLRRQENGWRIVGFSPEVEPGVYTFLNFERPDDMMSEYRRTEAEIERREQQQEHVRQARLPDMGGGTQR